MPSAWRSFITGSIWRGAETGRSRGRDFRDKHGIPSDRIVVLQASWLIPEKGVDDLLRREKAVAKNAGIHFLLAAKAAQRCDLERLADRLGIASM